MDRVVKNEGMPISRAPGQKGDLHIKINVQFPSRQARTRWLDAAKANAGVQVRGSWRCQIASRAGNRPSRPP